MAFSEFPFVRYTLFTILGICSYPIFWETELLWLILAVSVLYLAYGILVINNKLRRRFRFRILIPALAYAQLFVVGILACHLNDIRLDEKNLINHSGELSYFIGTTLEWDEPKARSKMNRVKLSHGFGQVGGELQGEIVVYHQADLLLRPGQVVLLAGSPRPIATPANPGQFDYQAFMLMQGVSHTHYAGKNIGILGEVQSQPILDFFSSVRRAMLGQIENHISEPSSAQIAKALLLGYKKQMDPEISQAYSATGAMHILAVSGLHVGIIYGFFFLFVKPNRLKWRARVAYLSLIILLIWSYACITGLSPSVLRAATMFTFIAFAQMQSRSPSIFNPIALSAMILLLFDPFLLFAVGFQLSYLALLGILLIQPLLVRIWLPPYRWLEYCWQISTVGIAAQLATFPVSAYYFHQFPSYFILSNLVAIPAAFLIMAVGIPFLLLSSVPIVSSVLAWLTDWLIRAMNFLIFWMGSFPWASVQDIHFELWEIGLYATTIATGIFLWNFPKRATAWAFVCLLGIMGGARVVNLFVRSQNNEVTWYALQKGKAIDISVSGQLWTWDTGDAKEIEFNVKPNRSRTSSGTVYPLLSFEKDGKSYLLGPNGMGMIEPSPDVVRKKNIIFAWENGAWVPFRADSGTKPHAALKAQL
ncbi:ComEC/Rec2 family competence protein [Mariniradius sediminis]|uniref:ComEC family competence protein n=1 Tax=Mariniradius sediminis TaxID=2909237 RepID=A0ABS9BSD4_9BACT|nr:ComEC/Rec2 family competence protein [Mariniradius sediminis]MCF1750607.1 ComEC family competence protein [Mariniradius sediminis]